MAHIYHSQRKTEKVEKLNDNKKLNQFHLQFTTG